ncbi:unnamed protein product [Ectocarpus sp. 13 AM-2016]
MEHLLCSPPRSRETSLPVHDRSNSFVPTLQFFLRVCMRRAHDPGFSNATTPVRRSDTPPHPPSTQQQAPSCRGSLRHQTACPRSTSGSPRLPPVAAGRSTARQQRAVQQPRAPAPRPSPWPTCRVLCPGAGSCTAI